MGFFSWRTQDTDRSIANQFSNCKPFTVFMIDNKGNHWMEDNYEGYGVFGGKDFYELLAEMNGLGPDRSAGIDLSFSGKPYISPNLVERKVDWTYTEEEPEHCEAQGYFYGGDEDDEEDDY